MAAECSLSAEQELACRTRGATVGAGEAVRFASAARQIQAPALGTRKLRYRATGRLSRDSAAGGLLELEVDSEFRAPAVQPRVPAHASRAKGSHRPLGPSVACWIPKFKGRVRVQGAPGPAGSARASPRLRVTGKRPPARSLGSWGLRLAPSPGPGELGCESGARYCNGVAYW